MISFQEVCLMYCGEKDIANIDKEQLIYCMHIYEGLVSLNKTLQDKKFELSEYHREISEECSDVQYKKLKEKYDFLYDRWEKFSKCLDMEPEKFISMLDDLKEKIKSKGNEVAQLREQLKTSELDAKRYKNDGIQDRVKLQEVMAQLESMTKMRDNWKADCEYSEKCFQAERDRRWELEEEVKQLKNQVQSLIDAPDDVCPKIKVNLSTYCNNNSNKDRLDNLYVQVVHMSQSRSRLYLTTRDGKSFFNSLLWVYLDTVDGLYKNDNFIVCEEMNRYLIVDALTSKVLYRVIKNTQKVSPVPDLIFEKYEEPVCPNSNVTIPYIKIFLRIGLRKIHIDKSIYDPNGKYMVCEDATNKKYCLVRTKEANKDFWRNYSIDKETLEVKVID